MEVLRLPGDSCRPASVPRDSGDCSRVAPSCGRPGSSRWCSQTPWPELWGGFRSLKKIQVKLKSLLTWTSYLRYTKAKVSIVLDSKKSKEKIPRISL